MKIFTSEELRNIEKVTIESGIANSLEMIDNAAAAITSEITSRWNPGIRLLVFAGWGNNGADALETSRLLALQGYNPEVYLFNINDKISPECRVCRDRLLQCGQPVRLFEITGKEPFSWPEPVGDSVIIDGLFGSGLSRSLPVPFQLLVRNINNSGATVVSIDVPSGMFGEWNQGISHEHIVHASLTLAIGSPRLAFLLGDNADLVGEWKVLDPGLSSYAIQKSPYSYYMVRKSTVRQFLKPRPEFCSKATFGSALLCAGSKGMAGAATLAAHGALRSGAGKVTILSSADNREILQTSAPCAMFIADESKDCITAMPAHDDRFTSIAVGPGIGTADGTIDALEQFLKSRNAMGKPVILDADALNCIALRPRMLDYLPVLSVITPHAGEFDRIFGVHTTDEERLRKAIDVSQFHRIIIVLKGHFTAIVRPDGKVFFNSSGTPAMATPGSGDVLTGILASFMAQGYKPEKATFMACFVHGVAGEIAAAEHGQYGVTAMDIAGNVGKAIARIME